MLLFPTVLLTSIFCSRHCRTVPLVPYLYLRRCQNRTSSPFLNKNHTFQAIVHSPKRHDTGVIPVALDNSHFLNGLHHIFVWQDFIPVLATLDGYIDFRRVISHLPDIEIMAQAGGRVPPRHSDDEIFLAIFIAVVSKCDRDG